MTRAVVCFLWPGGGYFPEHVDILERMVARHLPEPHRFVCVTDGYDARDFSPAVEVLPTPAEVIELGRLAYPGFGAGYPQGCLRKLWALSREVAELAAERLVLDVDSVIVDSLVPLFAHAPRAPFVACDPGGPWSEAQEGAGRRLVFGAIHLSRDTACVDVWERFRADPAREIRAAAAAGCMGADQGILTHRLGASCAFWPRSIGIYGNHALRRDAPKRSRRWSHPVEELPDDARVIQFNGRRKPWDCLDVPWVRAHWR